MKTYEKRIGLIALATIVLTASACGQPIEADYCVGVSIDESGTIGPDDNAYIVKVIDSALLPFGYEKSDAPASIDYRKLNTNFPFIEVAKNLGPLGTVISHYPRSQEDSHMAVRVSLINTIDEKIRPKYIVRDCEDIYPGSTPKLYD